MSDDNTTVFEFLEEINKLNPSAKYKELIVFGGGKMAGCLVKSFVNKGFFAHNEIILVTKTEASAKAWNEQNFKRAYTIDAYINSVNKSDPCKTRIVLLGVKPQARHDLYMSVSTQKDCFHADLVFSIMAGITLEMLKTELEGYELHYNSIVRLTPNTPCAVGSGLTLLYGSHMLANSIITKLMKSCGDVFFVPESSFNAASAIAGSGPAFAFLIIEALSDGGVLAGLPRENATKMAALMLRGASDLLLQSEQHPGQLKDQVCSPGGTTIAGIQQLEKHGLRSALIEAVLATKERNDQLAFEKKS